MGFPKDEVLFLIPFFSKDKVWLVGCGSLELGRDHPYPAHFWLDLDLEFG